MQPDSGFVRLPALWATFLTAVGWTATPALGQACFQPVIDTIQVPAQPAYIDRFGASMRVQGDLLVVGAPGWRINGVAQGAVLVFLRNKDDWNLQQTLWAMDGAAGDEFGAAVAISGNTLVVGAPKHDAGATDAGATYVFYFSVSRWEPVTKLQALVPFLNERYGWAVATDGDAMVVGTKLNIFANSPGAAFVYRRTDATWTFEKRLQPDDGMVWDAFGASVEVMGDTVLVGAPRHESSLQNDGACYVFRHIAKLWTQTQKLQDPQAFTNGEFGTSMSVDGDTVVIGAPATSSSFASGSASVWDDDGNSFNLQGVLNPPASPKHRQFGASLAIAGDQIIVGSPWTAWPNAWHWGEPHTAQYAGLAHVFERRDGAWHFWFTTRRTAPVAGEYVGQSVDLMDGIAIAGAGQLEPGRVFIFDAQPPDCDMNGSPDNCDTDCDRNNQADICELMQSPLLDCNANAMPDVCEAAYTYQIDVNQGLLAYGYRYVQPRNFLWLNQFTVRHGGEIITHLAVPWSIYQPAGINITALLYSDPNQDGNPSDAIALASVESQVFTNDDDHMLPIDLARMAILPTYVGEAGTSFFVGALSNIEVGGYPAYADAGVTSAGRSWHFSTLSGVMNIQQPGQTSMPNSFSRNWWLRAISLDCNGNGTWDQCDIDSGFSEDLNANGIPDECDAPCDGDIAGGPAGKGQFLRDGQVAIADLMVVIDYWGQTGDPGTIPGDIYPPAPGPAPGFGPGFGPGPGDGIVNIDDLLVIINTWGPCP